MVCSGGGDDVGFPSDALLSLPLTKSCEKNFSSHTTILAFPFPQDPTTKMLAVCDAAAAKIGPPVRGAEPAWSVVEAVRAASGGNFTRGMATEAFLFSRVRVLRQLPYRGAVSRMWRVRKVVCAVGVRLRTAGRIYSMFLSATARAWKMINTVCGAFLWIV